MENFDGFVGILPGYRVPDQFLVRHFDINSEIFSKTIPHSRKDSKRNTL